MRSPVMVATFQLIIILTLSILLPAQARSDTVVLQGGKIIPVVGEELSTGSILIKDGVIESISAEDPELPFDADVIDVSGKVLFPGMALAHTSSGVESRSANENIPVAPFVDVYDAIDPSSFFFEESLRNGITTINVQQGNDTVIGGMGRCVRPIGLVVEEMTVKSEAGLKIAMSGKRGYDAIVQAAALREAFEELDDAIDRLAEQKYEESQKEAGKKIDVVPAEARERGKALIEDDDLDDKHRSLYRLTRGRLESVFRCGRAMDVPRAIRFARDRGFLEKTTFLLGSECFKAIAHLKATGRPVILDGGLIHRETDPLTGEETETFVPTKFAEAGIPFALSINPSSSYGEKLLGYQAARCVREGIPRETALRAITTVPAAIMGLADRLGSLETGKEANILVLSGDPLDAATRVEMVYIEGRKAYDIEDDVRLRRLLDGLQPDMGVPESESGDQQTDEKNDDGSKADSNESEEKGW